MKRILLITLLTTGCNLSNSAGDSAAFVASATWIDFLGQSVTTASSSGKVGLYCGSSSAVSGALGGWTGVGDLCRGVCNGSSTAHMRTAHEIALSFQFGRGYASLSTKHWIAGWSAGATVGGRTVSECQGWTSASSTLAAAIADVDLVPAASSCAESLAVACCDFMDISGLGN